LTISNKIPTFRALTNRPPPNLEIVLPVSSHFDDRFWDAAMTDVVGLVRSTYYKLSLERGFSNYIDRKLPASAMQYHRQRVLSAHCRPQLNSYANEKN
jgi:hypothetical protein